MKLSILVTLGLVCLVVSCKKEQPQPNIGLENCSCAHEVSADFTIEEMTTNNPSFAKYTETDTIFAGKNVRFYGMEDNAKYTWYIGSEVLTTKEFKRYFSNALVGETISVSLVVKKKPNSICFPNDDGYDSITKTFLVAQLDLYDNLDTTFLEGTYRMKSPLYADSVDIIIDYKYYIGGINCADIYNYDGLGNNIVQKIWSADYNYKQFFWDDDIGTAYEHVIGDVHVLLNGNVEMNFYERNYPGNYIVSKSYDYKGRKL